MKQNKKYKKSGIVLFQDCALSLFSSLLSIILVRWLSEPVPGFTFVVLKWLGMALCFTVLGILISGSHKYIKRWSTVNASSRLMVSVMVKEIFMVIALICGVVKCEDSSLYVLLIFADLLFTTASIFYLRFIVRILSNADQTEVLKEISRKNALVSGANDEAIALAAEITAKGEYNVIGYITDDKSLAGRIIGNRKVYYCASPADIEALEWKLGGIDCIFMTKGKHDSDGEDMEEIVRQAPETELDVRTEVDHLVKRTFDVFLSGILILVFWPLALVIAIAIRLEHGSPVLYKQERVGLNGESFYILKFRSMRVDAEALGAQLFAGDDDPRLTKVGRFIRAHHLDELPQLLNVFVGDMSFVGYRPERPFYISKIMKENPRYQYLYQIRPGVTSYATLYNGYTDTMEKMLRRLDLDLYYLRHHSVMFDCKVLGLTFLSIVSGKKF